MPSVRAMPRAARRSPARPLLPVMVSMPSVRAMPRAAPR